MLKERERVLSNLVSERNKLVHNLLPELDISSFDSCKNIEKILDEQASRVLAEIHDIQFLAEELSNGRRKVSEYYSSEAFKNDLEPLFFQRDRLVLLLAEIATQVKRGDGWTVMSTAGQLVRQHAPKEFDLLHKGTEHKSLKSLMLKAEAFEFSEEPTDKGGVRVLYKLKEGFSLTYD